MSRCKACDKKLSDFELTRRSLDTGDYLDLCNHCFSTIADVCNVSVRSDLSHLEDSDGEAFEEYEMPELHEDWEG